MIFETVAQLKLATLPLGYEAFTKGYLVAGDGGGASYVVADTQAVDGYGDHELADGNVALLQSGNSIDVRHCGAVGDGVTDDTNAIQAALDTDSTEVYFSEGRYRIVNSTTSPALISSVADRRIYGTGVITATDQVKKALQVTGANTVVDGLQIDGNDFIGFAIEMASLSPIVRDCYIHDLNGFSNWGAIAIRLDFDGLDTSALICNNVIKNLQGVGDGTGGNGVGMQRAIAHETDQDCTKQILITGNVIEDVMGEEGDSIVIAGGTAADTKVVPAVISNNTINGWSRRGIKIAANGVTIAGNFMTNPLTSSLASLQRAIDCTSASQLVIKDNVMKECRFQLQIAVYLNSPQSGSDIVVSGNVIEGTGVAGSSALIAIRTYGSNVIVEGNKITWPSHGTRAIQVQETAGVRVVSNIMNVGTTAWYSFANSTDVRLANNINEDGGDSLTDNKDLRNFGAAGDGVTDDTVAVQAALDSGNPIIVGGGLTYKISSPVSMSSNTTLQDCSFDYSTGSATSSCIRSTGTIGSALTLTGSVVSGDTTLSLADSSSLAENDWILVSSSASYDVSSTNQTAGEIIQVQSSVAGTVTFRGPLLGSYDTADTAIVNKVSFVKNITLRNVTISGSEVDQNDLIGLQCFYSNNVLVESCSFLDLTRSGIQLISCINSKCTSSLFENLVQPNTTGYGFSVADATQDTRCENSTFNYCRHSWSTNNLSGYPGIPRRCVFDGNTVTSSAPALGGSGGGGDAIDTHSAAEDIHILNNTCYNSSGQGINFECRSGSIINNYIYDSFDNGIAYHNESDYDGQLTISGNTVERSGGHGIDVYQGARGTTAKATSVIVSNNIVRGSTESGIRFTKTTANGHSRNVVVTGNAVEDSTLYGIELRNVIGATVSDNAISGCVGYGMNVRDCESVTVSGNKLTSPTGSLAVLYINGCIGFSVTGNTVYAPLGTRRGLEVRGDSVRYSISGNTILSDSAGVLMYVAPTTAGLDTGGVVSGNVFSPIAASTGERGLQISSNIHYILVTSNTARGTIGYSLGSGTGNIEANNMS